MITITKGGIATIAPPTTVYEAVLNTQVSSAERNATGRALRETLPDKWKISAEWEFGSPQELYNWFNYLKTLTRIDFGMSFAAPTGNIETATFYISPISAKMINYSRGNAGWWKNLKCNFVEV